jgi:glycosyltransferase involved in cell wall biosynthesis
LISVVFATKNGGVTIERTLNSLIKLETDELWELYIVDNGSDDNTLEIIKKFVSRLPLTVLSEKKPGKNNALNAAIPYINGDIIVFTDDDVAVTTDWIDSIKQVCTEQPKFDIFAGDIVPEWEVLPASWILEWAPLGHLYAVKGDCPEGPCDAGKVWGPNMVVRKNVFDDPTNRFNPDIGPNGTSTYPMGSETEFTKRMQKKGFSFWNSKTFCIAHWVSKHSINEGWILNRAFRLGKGVTLCKYELGEPIDYFAAFYNLLYYYILKFVFIRLLNPKQRFWVKYKSKYHLGVLLAIIRKEIGF